MQSTYKPSSQQNLDDKTEFQKLGMHLADLLASDDQLNNQSQEYAENKCKRLGIVVDLDTLDENEVYWTFIQEYQTNAVIVALNHNRTHITGTREPN